MDLTSRSSFLREKWDVATHAWRFDLTRHVWLVRKWGKMKENKEFYWKKEFLEKSPIKVSKSFFNEIFKSIYMPRSSGHLTPFKRSSRVFSFQQSGVWQQNKHFTWFSTISHEENQFRMVMRNQWSNSSISSFLDHFAWLCQIFAYSCETTSISSLACNQFSSSGLFRLVMQNFCMIMRICNIWFLSFPLSFLPFPSFDSTLTTSN